MTTRVAQMSPDDLRQVISEVLEEKLIELFGDSDEGLELLPSVRSRLMRQKAAVANGEF